MAGAEMAKSLSRRGARAIVAAAAGIPFFLLYRADLAQLAARWSSDPAWSHGFVVPLLSLFLVRLRWRELRRSTPEGSWAGLPILLTGIAGQVAFRATGLAAMSPLSMLVVFLGGALFVLGWRYLRLLWLPIACLAFAFPPPAPLYAAVTTPMQALAAELGAALLPLLGCAGRRHGTIIDVARGASAAHLEVAQACSGMRMLTAFAALAAVLAYSTRRPAWQKLLLTAASLPIAILCNALRVAIAGALAVRAGGEWAAGSAHEYLGILMLLPALALQLGAAWTLDRLFVETPAAAAGAGR